jgi:uncharacterized protein (DUF433 family)
MSEDPGTEARAAPDAAPPGYVSDFNSVIALSAGLGYCPVSDKGVGNSAMTEHSRISLSADVLGGKPVVRGTRLAVEFVIGLLADGWSEPEILTNYPGIAHEDIIACLAYARDMLSTERVYPSAA